MSRQFVKLSKFISLILRHQPDKFGLQLDSAGWAQVDDLITIAQKANLPLDRAQLAQIVAENDKQRFSFSDDGQRIRANHGHSIQIDLPLTPKVPPSYLYHGTATRFLTAIQQQGLLSKNRQYVHLSVDEITAHKVGQRHGNPVILTVEAKQMAANGFLFYHSASNIWLTEQVPPEYIKVEDKG